MLIQIYISMSLFFGSYFGLFGRFFGKSNIIKVIIPVNIILITFLIYLIQENSLYGGVELILYRWLGLYFNSLNIGILIDALSSQMCLVVSIISLVVIIYATEYMCNDPHIVRFICYLFFFVFFMLFFITSGNIIQAFIGWEGVGIVSYLLISFWFTRGEANRSAFKAIVFNRFGDLGYIIFFITVMYILKTCNFVQINSLWLLINENFYKDNTSILSDLEIFFYFLFLGAMCKSAQVGLHAWLPDAMEGPTPVSALLHSATMVTAGVYIFLRLAPVLLFFIQLNFIMAIIGSITALVGASVAFFNQDIKKIIAYSTCSQLGILFSAIGIGNYNGCFFHITTHAFFKALLFLAAGCVIHSISDEQDIRKMGGLLNYIPYTAICMLIGILGLVGFPFLSGFYSKEFILFFSFTQSSFSGNFITILIFSASIFTILYGLKLYFLIFLTSYRGFKSNLKFISEPTFYMSVSIGLLSFLTIFAGYFLIDFLLYNNNFIWLGIFPPTTDISDNFIIIESFSFFIKIILFFLFIIFILFFYFYYTLLLEWRLILLKQTNKVQLIINFFNVFFFQTWMFNYLYTIIVYIFINFSFNILLYKVNNFIEYSFIINIKNSIYIFSNWVTNNFSNNFFKNLNFIIMQLLITISFVIYLDINKCLFLNFCFYVYYVSLRVKLKKNYVEG